MKTISSFPILDFPFVLCFALFEISMLIRCQNEDKDLDNGMKKWFPGAFGQKKDIWTK